MSILNDKSPIGRIISIKSKQHDLTDKENANKMLSLFDKTPTDLLCCNPMQSIKIMNSTKRSSITGSFLPKIKAKITKYNNEIQDNYINNPQRKQLKVQRYRDLNVHQEAITKSRLRFNIKNAKVKDSSDEINYFN